ncbi:MAG TPA: hypothetical protein VLE47_01210 [Candidatus Saccharimonadales bacterium]|nr:hypothetical protein [Candidatus Saccharimonadales bacterium]
MTKDYIIISIITVIVAITLVLGFSVIGGPGAARNAKFDQTRVSDLTSLKRSIEDYYYTKHALPNSLSDVTNATSYSDSLNNLKDPQTKSSYIYDPVSSTKYKLCATFDTDSTASQSSTYYTDPSFSHPKGYYCFNFNVTNY